MTPVMPKLACRKWLQCVGYLPATGTNVIDLVSPCLRSISPFGAAPAVIREAAKNSLAVKSCPLPDVLTKVSVTGRPATRWISFGVKP